MFTGIIEEIGTVRRFLQQEERYDLKIEARHINTGLSIGDSVAVNGVCLTVVSFDAYSILAQVVPQTVRMSNLKHLRPGNRVNLERAVAAGGRFGGHFVQGHVDGTAPVERLDRRKDYALLGVCLPAEIAQFCIPQGSLCVDGVSLTIASLRGGSVEAALVPHTLKHTTIGDRRIGDMVNIEVDLLSKYVRRHVGLVPEQSAQKEPGLSLAWIKERGF